MMRSGHRFCLLPAYFTADGVVEEEVELDGEIGLDSICAIARAKERRFAVLALLP